MNFPSFAFRGHIAQCWLFVYRAPVETVTALLPPQIEAVTKGGFAFWNIVVCRLDEMRPTLLPAAVGLGYWHVAYRLHVRARKVSGELIEGLFFVRSDCDRHFVAATGNYLTDFNFHLAEICVAAHPSGITGKIISPEAAASFELDHHATPRLAPGSPFGSLEEAANALEYQPAALSSAGPDAVGVVIVRRNVSAWRWTTVAVSEARWQFLDGRDAVFELCHEVEPVDYLWERRRVVRVKPCVS